MQTVIKLFIFAAIYVIGIVNLAKTNTVWTGDLSYRLIHLLLFITSVLALISACGPKPVKTPIRFTPWHAGVSSSYAYFMPSPIYLPSS